ncbi:MAG: hypothetical protein NTW01_09930 [Gammaproteobacteria bacterium]|jgi:hypothetical protein|uniref:hypothetical protein n=1 Tax=Nevskia sp. TaxID=1929292 RepID=UPI0040362591|nr:hypothetical protein [Gammaproteobacteria bacterium]
MSHLLMISAAPIPADDAEVWGDFDARSEAFEQHGKPPLPALLELLERLTARHPCISELREDQLESAVWADGPLRDGLMHDVAVLTVVPARVAVVLPLVRDTARALGLAVYDPQAEQVWRP